MVLRIPSLRNNVADLLTRTEGIKQGDKPHRIPAAEPRLQQAQHILQPQTQPLAVGLRAGQPAPHQTL